MKEKKKYSLDDLKQKLINYLMDKDYYEDVDAKIIEILFK